MTLTRSRPDIAPSPDIPPRRPPCPPPLLVALPSGSTRRVDVDGALLSGEFDESSLFVGIEHDPWVRVSKGAGGRDGYEVHYSTSVMQVPLSGPIPERIGPDTHPYAQDRDPGYTSEYADVSYNEAHRRKRAFGDGIRWHWGKDPTRSDTTIVRAYRDRRPDPVQAFSVPEVRVTHGAAGFDRLWLVVTPESGSGRGRSVLTGGVRDDALYPLPVEDIDITDRCWPVGTAPLDHDSYVRYCLRGLDGMRFSDAVSDVTARYVGQWPAGQIHILGVVT
ncbi:hypothetical protein [Rhodococcus sp. NPDC057529]|uniref:hypothetical protein n=1 Tax=Rhodococcus sp. NPDC057529 TaxID=3346158 RepID=UPI0036729F84